VTNLDTNPGIVKPSRRRSWPWGVNTAIAEIRAKASGTSLSFVYRARRLARYGDPDLIEAALLGLVTLPEAEKIMNGTAALDSRGLLANPQ
jgi:hypothetical protein